MYAIRSYYVLDEADVSGADFSGMDLSQTSFTGAKAKGAVFRQTTAKYARFQGADCAQADFSGAIFSFCNFSNAGLVDALLRQADLSSCVLARAMCMRADFSQARLDHADCSHALVLDRITSYNVCYTKLLRPGVSVCRQPDATGSAEPAGHPGGPAAGTDPDAAHGHRGALPQAQHQQETSRARCLPVPAAAPEHQASYNFV